MYHLTGIDFNRVIADEPLQTVEASNNIFTKRCKVAGSLFGGLLGFSTTLALSIYANRLIAKNFICMLPTEFLIIYGLTLTGIYKGAEIGSNLANRCVRSNS